MSLRRLTAFVVVVEMLGLGVFFSFLLGALVAQGGRATLDMSQFGEQWIEYWIMMAVVAIVPYGLYVAYEMANRDSGDGS